MVEADRAETANLLNMVIDFLGSYRGEKNGHLRLIPCRQAIASLKQALTELKRIADNQSVKDKLSILKSVSLDLAKTALNLAAKMAYPFSQVIEAKEVESSAELLCEGVIVRQSLIGKDPINLPPSSDFFIQEPLKRRLGMY